ncbi:hypothetical protein [Emticicia fontis]
MILTNLKGKLIALVCLFLLVFAIVTTLRQCSENEPELVTINDTKINSEIVAYKTQIETLERYIDSLETIIINTEKQRHENRVHTPNQSNQQHFGDLSRRYADPKTAR